MRCVRCPEQWLAHSTCQPSIISGLTPYHPYQETHSFWKYMVDKYTLAGWVNYWQIHHLGKRHTCRFYRYPKGDPKTDHSSHHSEHKKSHAGNPETLPRGRPALLYHNKTHRHRGGQVILGQRLGLGVWCKLASCCPCLSRCERQETTFRTLNVCFEL